ncbi:MAG: hypothetical protein ABJG68_15285 [Crocinitomicaceae bacterium]
MDRRRLHIVSIVIALIVVFSSCTKSAVDTRRLGGKKWMVTQLDLGTNSNSLLPTWVLEESVDDDVFTKGTWIHDDDSQAIFKWRFNYFEGTFSLLINENIEQDQDTKAFQQCSNLSGDYMIITDKKKSFEFESVETDGYAAIPVFIQLQPI